MFMASALHSAPAEGGMPTGKELVSAVSPGRDRACPAAPSAPQAILATWACLRRLHRVGVDGEIDGRTPG
jgi:hypothetical protein